MEAKALQSAVSNLNKESLKQQTNILLFRLKDNSSNKKHPNIFDRTDVFKSFSFYR